MIHRRPKVSNIRPAWYKADAYAIDQYTEKLYFKLDNLYVPDSLYCNDIKCSNHTHSEDRDKFIIDVMSCVIESSHECIPMSNVKHGNIKPNCPIEKCIPGWRDEVRPFKEDAAFWHSVWRSAGRPERGVLRDIMARTRNQYHYAIKRVKVMSRSIRARKLLEASEKGSINLLLEMKKIKGSKNSSHDLSQCVDGASGENDIVEVFGTAYYNTEEQMYKLKHQISSEMPSSTLSQVYKVTGNKNCCL